MTERRTYVGIGTLYRHFPIREAPAEAVYRTELAELSASADELLQRTAAVLGELLDR